MVPMVLKDSFVYTIGWEPKEYVNLINSMLDHRRNLVVGKTNKLEVPVLPLDRSFYIEVVFQSSDEVPVLTVRIRSHDLYLLAFKGEKQNQWYELAIYEWQRVFPDTTLMRLDASYVNLERVDGERRSISLGAFALNNAIDKLAKFPDPTSNTLLNEAKSLMCIILMFCEASRFKKLFRLISKKFLKGTNLQDKDKDDMVTLINEWDNLSKLILAAGEKNEAGEFLKPDPVSFYEKYGNLEFKKPKDVWDELRLAMFPKLWQEDPGRLDRMIE